MMMVETSDNMKYISVRIDLELSAAMLCSDEKIFGLIILWPFFYIICLSTFLKCLESLCEPLIYELSILANLDIKMIFIVPCTVLSFFNLFLHKSRRSVPAPRARVHTSLSPSTMLG